MLRLILLRHAKSAWNDVSLGDAGRPLAPRGLRDAAAMGRRLAEHGYTPSEILVSPAVRARQTFDLVLPAFAPAPRTRTVDAIYELMGGDYVELVRTEGGTSPVLMLIGHNSAMEETALRLAGLEDLPMRERMAEKFPTASAAVIDFAVAQWRDIDAGQGRLAAFLAPRSG